MLLALYGILPWRSVPLMPVEIMLLPDWFFFHLSKISYWGRTVLVPLLVLQALKPRARNLRGVTIDELFIKPPQATRRHAKAPHQNRLWYEVFRALDVVLKFAEPAFPRATRKRAIDAAVAFVTERLNGEDGLGAIFPAMANSVMMFDALGVAPGDAEPRHRAQVDRKIARRQSGRGLLPALRLAGLGHRARRAMRCLRRTARGNRTSAQRGLDWLLPLQELDVKGDWAFKRPQVRPGGWAFQYANPHYPDLDDTAVIVVGMARGAGWRRQIRRGDRPRARMDRGPAIERRRLGRLRRRQHP